MSENGSPYSARIHQAAGMVSIQANCGLEDSYGLMSDRSKVSHLSIVAIANAVVDHSIRFGLDE